jgi:hypothetical protein
MTRRRRLVPVLAAGGASVALALVGCSEPFRALKDPIDVEDEPTDAGTGARVDAAATDPPAPLDPLPPDSGASGRVLAHTSKELYRLEPVSRMLTRIGTFGCLGQGDDMLDIAVDRTGAVFGTSFTGFLTIDPVSAACAFVARGTAYPNSLSFVPVGTADATKEALVGYAFDGAFAVRYVRIDTATGVMTDVGTLNAPAATTEYVSSGDLVGLVNDASRAYLTVRLKPGLPDGGTLPDRLAEIDPATGRLKRILGDTKQQRLYGLGYWAGKGYAFSDDGTIVAIDMLTGVGTPIQPRGITQKLPWYGAGVSTEAPAR